MSEVKVNKISPRTNCGTVTVGDSGDSVSVSAGVPVTVNGDLKSNALKATDGGSIISQSGTNITIGASGDTISLASGASQTGFGRTGTVNWNTTKITADPGPAVSGTGYFTDTSGGAFDVTLPSSPSAGDIVAVADYANTWDTNNLTIARNSSNIEGAASDLVLNQEGSSITFVYVDATKGWIVVNTGNSDDAFTETFIAATGGNSVATCGNCKIHTFTGPGTFTVTSASNVSSNNIVSYVVVGGGGGGPRGVGGGSGAGGFREVKNPITPYTASPLDGYCTPANHVTVTATAFPITVGGGGAGSPGSPGNGTSGNPSTFSTTTSAGGGRGSRASAAESGGSGGGAYIPGNPTYIKGSGNTPPVSPPQGNDGGEGNDGSSGGEAGGGGGGAGAVGGNGDTGSNPNNGGPGGNGVTSNITGSPVTRAGGGGGSGFSGTGGAGGSGGGGDSGPGRSTGSGQAASANTGGGGGSGNYAPSTPTAGQGGNGGSGVVIIRYKFQ